MRHSAPLVTASEWHQTHKHTNAHTHAHIHSPETPIKSVVRKYLCIPAADNAIWLSLVSAC